MPSTLESLAYPENLREKSDEELLLAYVRGGSEECFDTLHERHERVLFNYVRHYYGNAEAAEDICQETWMQIHRKGETFETGRKFRPWLYTIATNQAIDYGRRQKRHRMASLDYNRAERGTTDTDASSLHGIMSDMGANEPYKFLENEERNHAINHAIREAVVDLPDNQRAVVDLVHLQGLKYREAADMLDVPIGTVKSRLYAAVTNLGKDERMSAIATS